MVKFYTLYQKNTDLVNSVPIQIDDNLLLPLLDKASDYDVSVVRFSLPNYSSALFTMYSNVYWVGFNWGGHLVTSPVYPVVGGVTFTGLYTVMIFIKMVNTAITTCYNLYNSTYPSTPLPSTNIPYFYYNETTELVDFTCEAAYYEANLPNHIHFMMNNVLIGKLSGFGITGPVSFTHLPTPPSVTLVDDRMWALQVYDNIKNKQTISGVACIVMTEQGFSFDSFIDMEGILIQTNMPIQSEILGQATGLPILSDFMLNDIDIKLFRNRIVYNPPGPPFRQVRLLTDGPLRSVMVKAYTVGGSGIITPMLLGPQESASVKLMFTHHKSNPYGDHN